MIDHTLNKVHNLSSDRILMLEPMEGKSALDLRGSVDSRLFRGENRLHAIMDKQSAMWYLRYDSGIMAESLKQRWTSFNKLLTFVTEYFKRRNVNIKEVID